LSDCIDDTEIFDKMLQPGVIASLQLVLDKPFEHLSYTQAVEILSARGQKFEFPVHWGADLQSVHERYLTETYIKGPVVLYDYPAAIKSF